MRKKLIAILSIAAMMATMIPSVALAAVKPVVTESQTVTLDGDVVATVYYGSANNGKVNVIVTGKPGAIDPIGENKDGWKEYKPNVNWNQWIKQYSANADENVVFAANWNGTDYQLKQTVNIKFYKFDTEKPVIDPENTQPDVTTIERGADFTLPALPVTDDITEDFTTTECEIYYSQDGADGSWATVQEIDTSKEGVYNVWYQATDDSGKKADGVRRTFKVVDTTAPVLSIEKIADMEKGDILDITEIKVEATDVGNVEKIWLNEILYSETKEPWDAFETVWKYNKGDDPAESFEMDRPGYYKLKYRASDDAVKSNTGYASTLVAVNEIYGTAGLKINYVDKDGKALAKSTEVTKENVVLSYEYDEDGNKATFYTMKYRDDFETAIPDGYTVEDWGGLTQDVKVAVAPGEEATAEFNVVLKAADKKVEAETTPPKTGDDMMIGLMAALITMTAAAAIGALTLRRKYN